ncbi:Retrovirus-related Pol polyprotein from transposon opus [Cucumis melo var. makuwa]|uniref:Retrovirus-related Pol polyprotein from transposon opus n=1 Tax=Cucumis melo var. makuwa TaxID=1194695 RepID=A0A5D3DTS7_CUCMM|nr:Retrovirus-related Pol polyprotein from transposon opus [Cucumis melo var. makuwa]TYK26690.1 Retrovirus-related Pol polyprotein from transposon opus [Cucumis melo var. makuwa]
MVTERIVLRHKISHAELEVDPVKIDVVSKLPSPSDLKPLRSFLRHVGFHADSSKAFPKLPNLCVAC